MTEREQIRKSIKSQLNSYRDLRAEHRQLTEELQRLEILMRAPSSTNFDGMPRDGSGVSNPVERMVIKHVELEERYKQKVADLVDSQIVIENMIEDLEPTERRLARFRYIDGLTWEDVCVKISYSWMQTHRIHGRMLDKLVDAEMERRADNEQKKAD